MKKTIFEQAGDFLLGRGFYIVLALCIGTIGFSAYYLINSLTPTLTPQVVSPVTGQPEITLPDDQPTPSLPVIPTLPPVTEPAQQTEAVAPVTIAVAEATTAPTPTETETVKLTAAPFTWPVNGTVIRPFNIEVPTADLTMGDFRTHDGIDISATLGATVSAPSRGIISDVYSDDAMGVTVVIEHADGYVSTLCNLAENPVVAIGDIVDTNETIGKVGATAVNEIAMDPHLHLSLTKDGVAVDPTEKLPEK